MAKSADVLNAIDEARAAGWTVHARGHGMYLLSSPACEVDHPTPDYVPDRWWGAETYRKLFQLSIAIDGDGRVFYTAIRISTAPWVGAQEVRVSLTKAIEFLRTDHHDS
ncbi:hypothetical protein J5X84_02330 [Streptosporangiaceae bacterium NEAU-GS5]|nr:hypothetical protein [Streptosporangiaceae bacterium NEAU-GS5]